MLARNRRLTKSEITVFFLSLCFACNAKHGAYVRTLNSLHISLSEAYDGLQL